MGELSGMTGFARVSGAAEGQSWTWEARSVNGKGLDVRVKMPPEYAPLDASIRKIFGEAFSRGSLQLSLSVQSEASGAEYAVNERLVDTLTSFAASRGEGLSAAQLLAVPGVVEERTFARSDDIQGEINAAITSSAQYLAASLEAARRAEGTALKPVLEAALAKIEILSQSASEFSAKHASRLQEALEAKFTELMGDNLPQDRLAQEAALLALKADVREELDRLLAHCEQGRAHLEHGSPIGRKLEFLSQELNREVNTLCSKSADIDLTRMGLELKSTVEQFREQAANVE